jgi:hypothetical protein
LFFDDTANMQIIKGNVVTILKTKGEGVVGFNRIYVRAAVGKASLANTTKLPSPGGILAVQVSSRQLNPRKQKRHADRLKTEVGVFLCEGNHAQTGCYLSFDPFSVSAPTIGTMIAILIKLLNHGSIIGS